MTWLDLRSTTWATLGFPLSARIHQGADEQQLAGLIIAYGVEEWMIQIDGEHRGRNRARRDVYRRRPGRNGSRLIHFNDGFVLDIRNAAQPDAREACLLTGTKCRRHAESAEGLDQRGAIGRGETRQCDIPIGRLQLTHPAIQWVRV